ncbi:splicing factor 3B subunit 1 [Histomonas meleagridis]|uniref:splicing factor 3B subunit 1 n=1 Tax=Histomonas meleagridis TaxID=135588 RepID=UPI00355AC9DF|nr:splicing factor 3B subunit 1 [Histomonas meleagridis]KAH0805240.1 splicing factor 3B subunit 1 [Histomonas meleagridis]
MSEDHNKDSKWDKITDDDSKKDPSATIVITQPTKKSTNLLANDIELTDEYLDSILPSKGFKIVPPPPSYNPVRREQKVIQEEENPAFPRVPKEFIKLYTDMRPDEELTNEEKKERSVMKLLMQVKDGTPFERKKGLRILTTHAADFGAPLIFSKLLPLLSSKVLSDHERHVLVKTIDRLMYRLTNTMREYVPQLLAFMGKMLIDQDALARAEAREVVSNLSKLSGLPVVLHSLRSGLDSEDKTVREITAQTITTAATSLGIPSIIPFLRAAIHTKKSWRIRHTGVRIIESICYQIGGGILPFLNDLVEIILTALSDDNPSVVSAAIRCVTTMAESSAPYGGNAFNEIIPIIWNGTKNYETSRNCMKAVGALLMTMDQSVASFHFREMYSSIINQFSSLSGKDKYISLIVFERALEKGAVDIKQLEDITGIYFKAFWNQRTMLEKKLTTHLVNVTSLIATKTSFREIIDRIFQNFKQGSPELRNLTIETFNKIIENNTTINITVLTQHQIEKIVDDLIFALNDLKENEERKNKLYLKCLTNFVNLLGPRIEPLLQDISSRIMNNLHVPKHNTRKQAAELLSIFAKSFVEYNNKKVILHFYGILQEFMGEEYPDVLAAILDATSIIIDLLDKSELDPPPEEIISRMVPILKNRNDKVAYASVNLIKNLSMKAVIVQKKEWMRICFELLELLKAEKRKVRMGAIEAFSCIAKSLGPFDVLLALLNNLQVQERQIRLCTTTAIAVLAEKCGPYNILPALMNEYRTPDSNVQNGSLKALQFLFQTIGSQCADYAYALTPLLTHALIERDATHRQLACQAVKNFALGLFASGKEDILIHLLNHVVPNVLESTMHFIDAVMDAIDAIRVSVGPGIVLQYTLGGLFHPARKVRSQFWRIYNNMVIYSGDALVPCYPMLENTPTNNYHRDEFDVFV